MNSGRWGARDGCGQFGKRFEMEFKVENHSEIGMSPDFLGEHLGVWGVYQRGAVDTFHGREAGERWEVH